MAQLQIELAWVNFAKTQLTRGNTPSFGKIGSMFGGDMMRQEIESVEIKSAKGQKSSKVGGAGQTQLEIEKFNLKLREGKLRKELEFSSNRTNHL